MSCLYLNIQNKQNNNKLGDGATERDQAKNTGKDMSKKLLDRFENSAKVRAIVEVRDEEGRIEYVTKTFDSIADAHRAMPYVSCSHIEDYCNSTYFSKGNHFFAYDGYYMPFSVENVLTGDVYVNLKRDDKNFNYRLLDQLNEKFWNEMAYRFIKDSIKGTDTAFGLVNHCYPSIQLAETLSRLSNSEIAKFMSSLYRNGWKKREYFEYAQDWLNRNVTREMYSKEEPCHHVVRPVKWSQQYKQQYF